MSKSSTFGINQRRHLCAAACRDRQTGPGAGGVNRAAAGFFFFLAFRWFFFFGFFLSFFLSFDYDFGFPALWGWWGALSEGIRTQTGTSRRVFAVAFVSDETLTSAERTGCPPAAPTHWDPAPSSRCARPPASWSARPPSSSSLRKCEPATEKLVVCTDGLLHRQFIHSPRHPSLFIHHAPGIISIKCAYMFACGITFLDYKMLKNISHYLPLLEDFTILFTFLIFFC